DGVAWTSYLRGFWFDLRVNTLRVALTLVMLGDQSVVMLRAIAVTLWRLLVSRRNMLVWETAADAERRPLADARGPRLWWRMRGGPAIGVAVLLVVVAARPSALPLVLPFALAWIASPGIAAWISRPTRRRTGGLSSDDEQLLRLTARKT